MNTTKKIRIVTLVALCLFVICSAFGGFITVGRYLIDGIEPFISAGDTFVESTRWTTFPVVLLLSILQVVFSFLQNRWCKISRVVLAALTLLVTILYKPLADLPPRFDGWADFLLFRNNLARLCCNYFVCCNFITSNLHN